MRYAYFDSEITGIDDQGMPVFDRAENSEMFALLFSNLLTNGVLAYPEGCFRVIANGDGMFVNVNPGFGMIKGRFAYEDTVTTLELEAPPANYSRIDRVVLRCNYLERIIELAVKTGEVAASPVPPELEQPESGDYYELCLANVRVSANATTITQSAITDTRPDSSVCGYITQFIDHIETAEFYEQFNAFYEEFIDRSDASFEQFSESAETAYNNYMQQIDQYITLINDKGLADAQAVIDELNKLKTESKRNFDSWFADLKELLDGDVAGNIYNAMSDQSDRIGEIERMISTNQFAIPIGIEEGDENYALVDGDGNAVAAYWSFQEKGIGDNGSHADVDIIDDSVTSLDKTWSSQKIASEMAIGGGDGVAAVDACLDRRIRVVVDAKNGNDSNPGTDAKPFKTMEPVYKYINAGHCNLRIAMADGKYDFKAFTLANTHIHFSMVDGATNVTLNFVPVYVGYPTAPDSFAFYNCHINCKGYVKGNTTYYMNVSSSTGRIYFDSGNLALTYVKVKGTRLGFFESGGTISNCEIDATRSVGSGLYLYKSIIGAIDSTASTVTVAGCTFDLSRTARHQESLTNGVDVRKASDKSFIKLNSGTFTIQSESTVINSTTAVAGGFINSANAFISIGNKFTQGSGFKRLSGTSKISYGVLSCVKNYWDTLRTLSTGLASVSQQTMHNTTTSLK